MIAFIQQYAMSALAAIIVGLLLIVGTQHFTIDRLEAKNKTLQAAEDRRVEAAKAAIISNKIQAEAEAKKLADVKKERENAIKELSIAKTKGADLQRKLDAAFRLRYCTSSNPVPTAPAESASNDTPLFYREGRDILSALVGEYRSLYIEAEKTRVDLIACSR